MREEDKLRKGDPVSPRTFVTNRLELASLKDIRRDLESKVARMQARIFLGNTRSNGETKVTGSNTILHVTRRAALLREE